MTPSLYTARLELRPGTATALRAALEGPSALARALEAPVPAEWPPELYDDEAIRWTLNALGDRHDGGPLGFYYVILRPGHQSLAPAGAVAGVGGFKGEPDANGEVELGYGIANAFQRHGLATEAVNAWVARAFADTRVRVVVGQTLRSLEPSIGVLMKAGFHLAGAGSDSDAPPGDQVIRYERHRAEIDTQ
jgi:ribosomal-protein-alanine N-acetyltransferase